MTNLSGNWCEQLAGDDEIDQLLFNAFYSDFPGDDCRVMTWRSLCPYSAHQMLMWMASCCRMKRYQAAHICYKRNVSGDQRTTITVIVVINAGMQITKLSSAGSGCSNGYGWGFTRCWWTLTSLACGGVAFRFVATTVGERPAGRLLLHWSPMITVPCPILGLSLKAHSAETVLWFEIT